MTVKLYEVGGCVRDGLLNLPVKDFDYAVEIISDRRIVDARHEREFGLESAFAAMREYLVYEGFEIFVENEEYGVIRARFPRGNRDRTLKAVTADFVLCRRDGPSSDGRRPDYVEVGTLADDLARRDFTVNALAQRVNELGHQVGDVIDNHDGLWDLSIKRLRFVGDPMERLREDGLRALRAIRFKITKGFTFDRGVRDALNDPETATLLSGVSVERRREELERCFHHDTLGTMELLSHQLPAELLEAIFTGNLRLSATQKRDVAHR